MLAGLSLFGLAFAGQPKVTFTVYTDSGCNNELQKEEYSEPCGASYNDDTATDNTKCTCDNIRQHYAGNLIYGAPFDKYGDCLSSTQGTLNVWMKGECDEGGGSKAMVIIILIAVGLVALFGLYVYCSGGKTEKGDGTIRRKSVGMSDWGPLPPEWTRYQDAEGTPYWYNSQTQETTWYRPKTEAAMVAAAQANQGPLRPASERADWTRYEDNDGTPYWHNPKTQESIWIEPRFEDDEGGFGVEDADSPSAMPIPPPVPAAAMGNSKPKNNPFGSTSTVGVSTDNLNTGIKLAQENPEAAKAAVKFASDNPEAAKKIGSAALKAMS